MVERKCNKCKESFPLEGEEIKGPRDLQPCFFVCRLPNKGEGLTISIEQIMEAHDPVILNVIETVYIKINPLKRRHMKMKLIRKDRKISANHHHLRPSSTL